MLGIHKWAIPYRYLTPIKNIISLTSQVLLQRNFLDLLT